MSKKRIHEKIKDICEELNDLEKTTFEGVDELENKKQALEKEVEEIEKIKVKWEGIVKLNVGGKKFATTQATLTQYNGSMLASLFSGKYGLLKDEKGAVFIDRDGVLFRHILAFLREGPNWKMPEGDASLVHRLKNEFEYYGLILPLPPTPPALFEETTLLSLEQQQQLQNWLESKSTWKLIYKGSIHGFSAANFHTNCDNKGETTTVILSDNNYLFGGYTPTPWTSTNNGVSSPQSFLFTLTNPANSPAKYINANSRCSVHHRSGDGPTFGGGYDLYIVNNCNNTTGSYFNFPHSYYDNTGRGNLTFTGNKDFTVRDVEVFLKKH